MEAITGGAPGLGVAAGGPARQLTLGVFMGRNDPGIHHSFFCMDGLEWRQLLAVQPAFAFLTD